MQKCRDTLPFATAKSVHAFGYTCKDLRHKLSRSFMNPAKLLAVLNIPPTSVAGYHHYSPRKYR
jgi:hypothetical protein